MPVYDQKNQKVGAQYNIIVGITLKEHETILKKREKEIRTDLKTAHEAEKKILLNELSSVSVKLGRLEESYEQHVNFLKERIEALEKLQHDFPEEILKTAEQALGRGDESKADDLFRKVEEKAVSHIKQAAEAAYQRGLIAHEQIKFKQSYAHFKRASRLVPDNSKYLRMAGFLAYELANYTNAIGYHNEALNLTRKFGDRRGEGINLDALGHVYLSLDRYDEAIEHFNQALAIAREIGERQGEGSGLDGLGKAFAALDQCDEAVKHFNQALAIARKIGDRRGIRASLANLGNVYYSLGQHDKAIEYYNKALTITRKIGDRQKESTLLGSLGSVYLSLGYNDKAIEHLENAVSILRKIEVYGGKKVQQNLAELSRLLNIGRFRPRRPWGWGRKTDKEIQKEPKRKPT